MSPCWTQTISENISFTGSLCWPGWIKTWPRPLCPTSEHEQDCEHCPNHKSGKTPPHSRPSRWLLLPYQLKPVSHFLRRFIKMPNHGLAFLPDSIRLGHRPTPKAPADVLLQVCSVLPLHQVTNSAGVAADPPKGVGVQDSVWQPHGVNFCVVLFSSCILHSSFLPCRFIISVTLLHAVSLYRGCMYLLWNQVDGSVDK